MNSIYRAASAVSTSSVPKRNGSVGSFRSVTPQNLVPNLAVSRALNSDSPSNSRKSQQKEGSHAHPLTQVNINTHTYQSDDISIHTPYQLRGDIAFNIIVMHQQCHLQSNKESSFRHSFRKEQRSFRQAIVVDQRPMLLPSLHLPDPSDKDPSDKGNVVGSGFGPSDKGNTDHPQGSRTAAMDLLVPSDKDTGAKISSLCHSDRSTRSSLQRLALARDPANERVLDPLAPAAQATSNPQTSTTSASFMSRVLRR